MAERAGSVEVVIKGGRPWGFTLQGGMENRSALTIAQIDLGGKAHKQGVLLVGDHVIKINDVQCLSLTDALQLIDCAFRTLTLLIWRSGSSSCDKGDPLPRNPTQRDTRNQFPKSSSTRNSLRAKGSLHRKGSADHLKCLPNSTSVQRPQKTDQIVTNDVVVWGPQSEKSVEIYDCANDNTNSGMQLSTTDHHSRCVTGEYVRKIRHRHSSSASTASSSAPVVPTSPKDILFQSSDQVALPRHQRSPRKLTKDSGYETSAQGEPDYVNADWISRDKSPPTPASSPDGSYLSHHRTGSHCRTPSFSGDESFSHPYPDSGLSRNSQGSYTNSRDLRVFSSYSCSGINRSLSCYSSSESLSLPPQFPPANRFGGPNSSRYSSTDSLVSWSSGRGASSLQTTASSPSLAFHKSDRYTTTFQSSASLYHPAERPVQPPPYQASSLSNLARSTPNLDIEADMVTRRFNKKRSVYEALANKSGLDFSPFIQRQPYWERRDVFEDESVTKKISRRPRGSSLPLDARDSGGPRSLPSCGNVGEKDHDGRSRSAGYRYRRGSQSSQSESISTIPEKQSMVSSKDRPMSPPSIPERDSSLRYRTSSGHEKYPSWPVTSPEAAEISSHVSSSSYRSNSWTQPTEYPKEQNSSYSRPKKMYQISPQQLHPVQEKASDPTPRYNKAEVPAHLSYQEKEVNSSKSYSSDLVLTEEALSKYLSSDEAYLKTNSGQFPSEREYNTHSPPERDTTVFDRGRSSNKFYDDESYSKNYGDMLRYYSQSPALYGNWNKDALHGVGQNNVVSDSNTPLLDRLRSEKQTHLPTWPPTQDTDTPSETGTCTDSVDSNSSSQETLKWHGSYNDLSSLHTRMQNMPADYDSDQSTIADSGCLTPSTDISRTSLGNNYNTAISKSDAESHKVIRKLKLEPMKLGLEKETVSFCLSGHKRELKTQNLQETDKTIRQSMSSKITPPSQPNSNSGTSSYENRIQKLKEENKNRGVSQAFQTSFPGFSKKKCSESFETTNVPSPIKSRVSSDSVHSKTKICDSNISEKKNLASHSNYKPERRESYGSVYNNTSHHRSRQKDDRKESLHYMDQHKRHRVSDPELKAIQKQAVLSFYHRQTALESGEFSEGKSSDRSLPSFSPPHPHDTDATQFNYSASSPRSPTSKEKILVKKPSPALPPKPRIIYSTDTVENSQATHVQYQKSYRKDSIVSNDGSVESSSNTIQSVNSEVLQNSPISPKKKSCASMESSFFNSSYSEYPIDHQQYFVNESVNNSPVKPKPHALVDQNADMWKTSHSKQPIESTGNKVLQSETQFPVIQVSDVLVDTNSLPTTQFTVDFDPTDLHHPLESQNCSAADVIYENVTLHQPSAKSAHSSRDLKERTTDPGSTHGFLWSHTGGRKAHFKKIYNSNETAVVKVISSEGETLIEALETSTDEPQLVMKPRVPPKCVKKIASSSSPPLAPPPSLSRGISPTSAPPTVIQDTEEDEELRQIEDSLQNQIKLNMLASTTSSPDLPLPPPPANNDIEVLHTDDPLPPPPLEITEPESILKSQQRSLVSEPEAVSYNLSYQHHRKDNIKSSNSPHSILPEPPVVTSDVKSSHVHQSAPKDAHNLHNVPNTKCQFQNRNFVEDCYPKVFETFPTRVQDMCVPHQYPHCKKEIEIPREVVEVPLLSREDAEEEVLYANLDLLRHHIKNGDSYSFVANGLEHISPSSIIVTNSATQTSNSTNSLSRKETKVGKSQAELECERLSRDFIMSFGDATLRNLLLPTPNHKTMSDYMEGLLDIELEKGGKPTARPSFLNRNTVPDHIAHTTNINAFRDNVGLPLTSAYFTTSEPKAKLLNRYCHSLESKDWTNEVELKDKKEELIASIGKKLEILRFEQVALQDEVNQNEQLGREVTSKVQQLAKPNENEKYRLHVEEMEKIINLLLSLSGRLARAQNALVILPKEAKPEERCILEAKRDKLYEQHEEARRLKESINRRSQQVSQFLHDYLTKDEYADYDHFIKMKSKLLMDARELDEKIKLGEEQLAALRGSMDTNLWNGPTLDLHSHTIVNRT